MVSQEHRQWQRIPVAFEAKYRDKESSFTPYRNAELTDIHHQGCRLLGGENFKRGKVVSILVDLPLEGSFHIEGVAAWSLPVYQNRVFETGIRFLTDDPVSEEMFLKLFHFCLINTPKE